MARFRLPGLDSKPLPLFHIIFSILYLHAQLSSAFVQHTDEYGPVVTINIKDGFLNHKYCIQYCLWNPQGNDVRAHMGCPSPNGYGRDDCFCRNNLLPNAYSWISACVSQGCSASTVSNIATDITSGLRFFDNYCADIFEPGSLGLPRGNTATTTVTNVAEATGIDDKIAVVVVETLAPAVEGEAEKKSAASAMLRKTVQWTDILAPFLVVFMVHFVL